MRNGASASSSSSSSGGRARRKLIRSGIALLIGTVVAILVLRFFFAPTLRTTQPSPLSQQRLPTTPTVAALEVATPPSLSTVAPSSSSSSSTPQPLTPLLEKPTAMEAINKEGIHHQEAAEVLTSPTATLHTSHGDIVFRLFPEDAPKTVANFVRMSRVGVFNRSCFYRYEKGFVLQGGLHCNKAPPLSRKSKNVPLEYKRPNAKYTVALARAGSDLNSGGSEFFINLRDNTNSLGPSKKGGYAVFAEVADGFDTMAALKKLPVKTGGLTRFVSPQPTIEWIEIKGYLSPAGN